MNNTISRVTAAMTAIYNENSVSLANLNVDFTLIKLEAPTRIPRRRTDDLAQQKALSRRWVSAQDCTKVRRPFCFEDAQHAGALQSIR